MESTPSRPMPEDFEISGLNDQSPVLRGRFQDGTSPQVGTWTGVVDSGLSSRTVRAFRQSDLLLDINRRMLAPLGMLDAAHVLASRAGINIGNPTENDIYDPENAYEFATEVVERDPDLLPTAISWRWEMELRRGVVNFDPRDPEQYKKVAIGSYMKRIIPDRVLLDTEVFSRAIVPVYLPFETKYPNNFDFTMAKPGQKLLSIDVEGNLFDVFASNSPLAQVPHTLLAPKELRSQFLQPSDIDAVSKLREKYPIFHFVYSSMGAGAGVNHQHWHMMAGRAEYPVLSRPVTVIHQGEKAKIGHYPQWPVDCLTIERADTYGMDIEKEFIHYLQQNDMPHNLFVDGNRTWITPRSHTETSLIPGKKYGAWETVLGVCNTGTRQQYDFVDEPILERALHEIQLDSVVMATVIQKLKSLI